MDGSKGITGWLVAVALICLVIGALATQLAG